MRPLPTTLTIEYDGKIVRAGDTIQWEGKSCVVVFVEGTGMWVNSQAQPYMDHPDTFFVRVF